MLKHRASGCLAVSTVIWYCCQYVRKEFVQYLSNPQMRGGRNSGYVCFAPCGSSSIGRMLGCQSKGLRVRVPSPAPSSLKITLFKFNKHER